MHCCMSLCGCLLLHSRVVGGLVSSMGVMLWRSCVWTLLCAMGPECVVALLGGFMCGGELECGGLGWCKGCSLLRLVCVAEKPDVYGKGLGMAFE